MPRFPKKPAQGCLSNKSLKKLLEEGAKKIKKGYKGFKNPTELHGSHDKKFWFGPVRWGVEKKDATGKVIETIAVHVLILKPKILPSVAYKAMFDDPSKWTFCCATFTQAVFLYFLLKCYGPTKFDERLRREARIRSKNLILFKSHMSTGIGRNYKRWDVFPAVKHNEDRNRAKKGDNALRTAPIGTHVIFTNADGYSQSSFYNENAIKIGNDRFIALGVPSSEEPFAKRGDIVKALKEDAIFYNKKLSKVEQIVSVTWLVEYNL